MPALSSETLLRVWEIAQNQHPIDQALTILAAGYPGMSRDELALLSIGQRDARLLSLYEQTFGPHLIGAADCPNCHEWLEFELAISAIRLAAEAGPAEPGYQMESEGYELRFRLPNSFDLAAIIHQSRTAPSVATGRALLAQRCVERVVHRGQAVAVADLPAPVIAALAGQMAKLDPQAELVLQLSCPACSHAWSALLDIVVFLWDKISAQARRLLREVHTLARAYSWSEADILAMSAGRRQFYIDMVTA
jgi:hypothetical protein